MAFKAKPFPRWRGLRIAAVAAALLCLGVSSGWAQSVPLVRWPRKDTARALVGPPDDVITAVDPDHSVTAGAFDCGTYYANLAALLGVPVDVLTAADIIAFELNGDSPGESGGWESAEWLFSDGRHSLPVIWDAVAAHSVPATAVIGNGSITAESYETYFGITLPRHDRVVSFQLLDLPSEINVDSAAFRVSVKGFASGEGTPDPDAVGVISRACACHCASRNTR